MCCSRRSERQHGSTLVELVTALAVGMMVTVAAMGTLAFVQTTAKLQAAALQLQQSTDAALAAIGSEVQQAGTIELVDADNGAVRLSTAFDGYAGSGQTVQGTQGTAGLPDTLAVSRQDDGQARDCLGNRPDAAGLGKRIDSRFTLTGDTLRCLGSHAAAGSQTIASGIEDFQVLFGLRSQSAGTPAYQFVDADAAAGRWHEVAAIRVCLQIRADGRHPQAGAVRNCHGQRVAADGHLRRVTHASFWLRNTPV